MRDEQNRHRLITRRTLLLGGAQLALTGDAFASVRIAKAYVAGAIGAADRLGVGSGHGPTHHFHRHW